jgi:glycosyltransferase involved in cell wall biosynthesis
MFSIALCTYNGQRFLRQQLESLSIQTLLPSELVACDDLSSDGTLPILHDFANRAPFPVRIYRNSSRLGVIKNFEQAIAKCCGDLIALADQDDVWFPEKLKTILEAFTQDPKAEAVFTDAVIISQAGRSRRRRLSHILRFSLSRIENEMKNETIVSMLAQRNVCTGATMALRREILPFALPFPTMREPFMIHDGWIAVVAAARGTLRYVGEPLIGYRRHPQQQIGPGIRRINIIRHLMASSDEYRKRLSNRAEFLRELFLVLDERVGTTRSLTRLQELIRHYQIRATLPSSRIKRLKLILRSLLAGDYYRSTHSTFIEPAADLLLL